MTTGPDDPSHQTNYWSGGRAGVKRSTALHASTATQRVPPRPRLRARRKHAGVRGQGSPRIGCIWSNRNPTEQPQRDGEGGLGSE